MSKSPRKSASPSFEDGNDPLEKLQENLYSRRDQVSHHHTGEELRPHESDVKESWGDESKLEIKEPASFLSHDHRLAWLKRLLIASGIFFALAVIVSLFMFFGGANSVSSSNVDISVNGPIEVAAGSPVSLEIGITNENNTDLEATDILIEYPEGTRRSGDLNSELRRYRDELGEIRAGATIVKKVEAVLFGEEGAKKEITVTIEYRVKGSNATFYKEKKYEILISSAPVTITVDSVKEANSNQEIEFVLGISSNSNTVINNLLLRADYPFGFEFKSAAPVPSFSNNAWSLGDFKPGAKRTIKVRGRVQGLDGDERTFRFSLGTTNPKDERILGTTFLTATQAVAIKKPFIGIDIAFDGEITKDYVSKAGKTIRSDVSWINNTGAKIANAEIAVRFNGSVFDRSSVFAGGGFYRSFDNTVEWDQNRNPELEIMNPGDSGRVSFSFSTLSPGAQAGIIKNGQMNLEVTVKGRRLGDGGEAGEEISVTETRVIKLATDITLSPRIVYFTGPFTNTGPIPPKTEQQTTYTVIWTVANSSNSISRGKVTATLPPYVKWLSASTPSSETVSYNPLGGAVTWDVGDIKAGTGFGAEPREIAFQLALFPSLTQEGSVPILISDMTASGEDTFTGATIRTSLRQPLTTLLSTDPSFKAGQEVVTK